MGDKEMQPLIAEEAKKEAPQRLCHCGTEYEKYIAECANTKAKPQTFCDNEIKTSKYTLNPFSLNFVIFKNLYEQFQRAANVYFLFIAILQIIPGLSPTGRFTTIAPLSLVMFLSLLKDSFEDYKRHRQDAMLNGSECTVLRDKKWGPIKWRDVRVGDIMRIDKGDSFPADMVIISSTEPEGLCYIETASLDGETNLKIRKACTQTYAAFKPDAAEQFGCQFQYEMPNNRLYNFDGNLVLNGSTFPLNNESIFLRGACLRNTEKAWGAVIFTGQETKLMKNSSQKRHKMSNIDVLTNRQVGFIFIFQLCLAVFCACGLGVSTANQKSHWYLANKDVNPGLTAFIGFFTFLILFNTIIPISLYVSMEMVKLVQANVLINHDKEMYHPDTDTPALARTSALNEELGQVSYIFSDKTGTLTCNIMDFVKFTCLTPDGGAVSYGTGVTEIARAAAKRTGKTLVDGRPKSFKGKDGFCFYDPRINIGDGKQLWRDQANRKQIEEFVCHLGVCHTVVAEYKEGLDQAIYQAASPDEGCLVKAARELGVVFESRTETAVNITVCGEPRTYQLLNIIEFDSTRKRMSVIVRDPAGKLLLLCKGADSVIYERIKREAKTEKLLSETLDILTVFAAEGLRTLVIAKAELDEKEYKQWADEYEQASCALVDRAGKMAKVGERIEKDLTLIGTTAIEDKLQHEVPDTIELLMSAGIKVWVLTGDKQETAINIGYACALLNNEMTMWIIDEMQGNSVVEKIQDARNKSAENKANVVSSDMALVIQGGHLEHVLGEDVSKDIEGTFLDLGMCCKAVICCRVSPLQKAQVVSLVRENVGSSITLAIGDGANDVSMIQSANVGIGIAGVEGLQAARASDYSIGQFRFLQRLLLVHGRWDYRRISRLILYSFYKNICLYLTQFWFCIFNGFSGQSLYDPWALAVYNVFFTFFPILIVAIFDRDIEDKRILAMTQFPDLYCDGLRNRLFNTKTFWVYTANAIYHAACCFFIPMVAFITATDSEDGSAYGMHSLGVMCYSTVVLVVSLKLGLETLSWTWVNVWFLLGSVIVWFIFIFIYGAVYGVARVSATALWYYVPNKVVPTALYWFVLILCCTLILLRDFCFKVFRRNFHPELSHVIQVLESSDREFSRTTIERNDHLNHLLNPLETNEPKRGGFLVQEPSLKNKTGYAFSQEEGQADITKTFSRAFGKFGGKKKG